MDYEDIYDNWYHDYCSNGTKANCFAFASAVTVAWCYAPLYNHWL